MEFGTTVLSKTHSLFSDHIRFPKETTSSQILGVDVGKFIYKRPDNGKIIIELNNRLMELASKDLLLFTKKNYYTFQNEINGRFTSILSNLQEKLIKLKQDKTQFLEKTKVIEETMRRIVEKNKEEYSENREKSLAQLEKNQRKHHRKVESFDKLILETTNQINLTEKAHLFSLTNIRQTK